MVKRQSCGDHTVVLFQLLSHRRDYGVDYIDCLLSTTVQSGSLGDYTGHSRFTEQFFISFPNSAKVVYYMYMYILLWLCN